MVIDDIQQKQDENSEGSAVGSSKIPSKKRQHPQAELNAGISDPTDGRERYDWTTCYSPQALSEIRCEAIYLFIVLLCSLFLIFAMWKGWFSYFLSVSPKQVITLKQYAYYAASGMLGGVTFDIKYLYRSVARGYWNQDRRIWRIMSPFIAMTVAFVVGAMVDASLISTQVSLSGAAFVSIGFLTGYFADHAVAKMYEVACVLFGRSATTKAGYGK